MQAIRALKNTAGFHQVLAFAFILLLGASSCSEKKYAFVRKIKAGEPQKVVTGRDPHLVKLPVLAVAEAEEKYSNSNDLVASADQAMPGSERIAYQESQLKHYTTESVVTGNAGEEVSTMPVVVQKPAKTKVIKKVANEGTDIFAMLSILFAIIGFFFFTLIFASLAIGFALVAIIRIASDRTRRGLAPAIVGLLLGIAEIVLLFMFLPKQ